MGLVTGEFYFEKSTWASRMYNVIHPHTDEVTLVNNNLRFYDRFSISIANNVNPAATLIYDGSSGTQSLSGMGYWTGDGTCVYTLAVTDNVFYFYGWRKGYPAQGTFIIVCLKDEDKYFAGCYGGQSESFANMNGITLYDAINTGRGPYTIRQIANFSLASPKIAYTDKLLFANSSNDAEVHSGLLSSSSVTLKSTITIDGKNYYAVGGNILLPLS